jgi:uncharacterized protein
MLPKYLNPTSTFHALDAIDNDYPSFTGDRKKGSRVTLIVLFSVCVSLLMLDYLKNYTALYTLLTYVSTWQELPPDYWLNQLHNSIFGDLFHHAWWGFWHVITYVLIPIFVLKVFIHESPLNYGWRWGQTHKHWQGYLALLSPILVFVVMVSYRKDFVDHYPFYNLAGRSFLDFLAWETIYLIQFASLEFFFRGYIVQTLRPYYGSSAIWIMIVPYLMIHFGKPWLEATGAIFFGLFLGILALRSRSIWGGFCVHAGVAISMDIASLMQQDELPQRLLPF